MTFSFENGFAQDLQGQMDSFVRKDHFYEYFDEKSKNIYSHGYFEQVYIPTPIFRRVDVDKKRKIISIEGITTWGGKISDTSERGLCCFEILLAKADSKGRLYKIRRFPSTMMGDNPENDSKRDGFFRLNFETQQDDILIFGNPGENGNGIRTYFIGKLLR